MGNINGRGKGFPNCYVTAFTLCYVHTNINILTDEISECDV